MVKICVSSMVEFFLFWSLCLSVEKKMYYFSSCYTYIISVIIACHFLLLFDSPLYMLNIRCPITFVSFLYLGSSLDTPEAGKFPHTKDALTSDAGEILFLLQLQNPELDH